MCAVVTITQFYHTIINLRNGLACCLVLKEIPRDHSDEWILAKELQAFGTLIFNKSTNLVNVHNQST